MHDLTDVDSADLIDFAKAWASLGDAVTEQVEKVLEYGTEAEVNPNAIRLAQERIGGRNEEIDDALEEWLAE